ncbi:MAG: hypothetical protein WBD24_06865 [Candidatus Omnitrophota bacterium]
MNSYKNRHRIWLKTIAMVVVCLFTLNTISWAYPGKRISYSRHTLAPRSIFKPLTDEGIVDTAEIKYEIIAGVRLLLAGHSPVTVNGILTETYKDSENKRKIEFFETVEKRENSITAHFKILGKNNVTFEIKYQDTKTSSMPESNRDLADDVDVKDARLEVVNITSLERLHYGSVFQENDVIKITKRK